MTFKTVGAVALIAASSTVAYADDWTAYTYSSVSTTSAVKGMTRIAERVAAETEGDLTIDLHLGKTLQIASADITQAVGDGIIDMAADFFFSGSVPLARVLNLPMLIENDEEWAAAYLALFHHHRVLHAAAHRRAANRAFPAGVHVRMTHTYPFPEPVIIDAEVFTELPDSLRRTGQSSYWAEKNRRGAPADSFLEGPSFDRDGNLYFVDIPFGRVFRTDPTGQITQIAEYDGQPNGLKIHRDGRIFLADYQNGIMVLDPATGTVTKALGDADTESFKGCNDLHFGCDGALYFTDQGQTGLHDPSGRVWKWMPETGALTCLIDKVPSPNGLVLDLAEHVLFLAVTRANAVWRLPMSPSGRVNKAGLFIQFSGGRAGPDGLALTSAGGVVVCQTGMGLVWLHDVLGRPIAVVRSPSGLGTTNCAFGGPDGRTLFITESDRGSILKAEFPEELGIAGAPMFSSAL